MVVVLVLISKLILYSIKTDSLRSIAFFKVGWIWSIELIVKPLSPKLFAYSSKFGFISVVA